MKAATDTSLKKKQLRYKQVRCKICCGTGIEPNFSIGRCPKCRGTGWRLFPEGQTEKCLSCSGRGKEYRFTREGTVCQECDGFGEIKLI